MSFALRSMTQTAPCGIKACLSIIYYYDATPQDSFRALGASVARKRLNVYSTIKRQVAASHMRVQVSIGYVAMCIVSMCFVIICTIML